MDYSKYSSSFSIDWLEVEITLNENSNQQTIRRKVIEASRRFGLNIPDEEDIKQDPEKNPTHIKPSITLESSGGACKVFKFKLFDIQYKKQVIDTINALHDEKNISEVKFTAIEIARDFRSMEKLRDLANREHAELLAHYYKFMRKPASNNHRVYDLIYKSTDGVLSKAWLINHFTLSDTTIWIGSQKKYNGQQADPVAQRLYNKVTDRNKPLDPSTHRARFEITLQGKGMPFSDIGGLMAFKLETQASHFYLSKLTDAEKLEIAFNPLKKLIFNKKQQIGAPQCIGMKSIQIGKNRLKVGKFYKGIEADKTENRKIKTDLENLTKSLNRNMK